MTQYPSIDMFPYYVNLPQMPGGYYLPQCYTGNVLYQNPSDYLNISQNIKQCTVQYPAQNAPAFKGAATEIVKSAQDSVEIQDKATKKEKSVGAKIALWTGTAIGGIVLGVVAFSKHQTAKLNKLYKEKLVPKVFDKELTFADAATKEDAIKFAKETLGVKDIDESMTLDALNYANHGITDVVNKNIGQEVFIPRSYLYAENDNFLAAVCPDIESKNFGRLTINKNAFDDAWLTDQLDRINHLRAYKPKAESAVASGSSAANADAKYGLTELHGLDSRVYMLSELYEQSANNLTIAEKRILYYSYHGGSLNRAFNNFDFIKFVEEQNHNATIKFNVDNIRGLSKDEQQAAIRKFLVDNKLSWQYVLKIPYEDGSQTIYHEMGHLQDMAKNLKNINLSKWKLPSFKEAWNNTKNKDESSKTKQMGVDEYSNRWYNLKRKDMKKLFDENPEKFKKKYPDLYEFLTKKEYQDTAKKISDYSATGIGEFIAETYAEMIAGKTIPEDVMALYKKYNGPLPKGYS